MIKSDMKRMSEGWCSILNFTSFLCFYSFPCEQVVSLGDSMALSFHTAGTVLCNIWFGRGPALSSLRESHRLAIPQLVLS